MCLVIGSTVMRPTSAPSAAVAISVISLSSAVTHNDGAAHIGDTLAVLVSTLRVHHDEFQRAVFLVINIGDTGPEGDPITRTYRRVISETLLAMQHTAEINFQQIKKIHWILPLHLKAEEKSR